MLSMWLSHDSNLIDTVNKINRLHFALRDDIIYKYYMDKVPKGKRWIKWVKKEPKDERIEKRIEEITGNSKLSKKEAKRIALFEERIKNR